MRLLCASTSTAASTTPLSCGADGKPAVYHPPIIHRVLVILIPW
jgi:hypothetical protein